MTPDLAISPVALETYLAHVADGIGQRELLDRVGDMRDDLHRLREVVPGPFLADDLQVHLSGG